MLEGNGSVSHIQAMNKAETEYKKYKQKTISSVERAYLDVIKQIQKDTKNNFEFLSEVKEVELCRIRKRK